MSDPASTRARGRPAAVVATVRRVHDQLTIRPAEPGDAEVIFGLIVELATYERAPEQVVGTPQMLRDSLFGEHPSAEAILAFSGETAVGFALFHGTFSTWECRAGIWLEDLYVP